MKDGYYPQPSDTFKAKNGRRNRKKFNQPFRKLATSSTELVHFAGSLTYQDMNLFIKASFHHHNAAIIGRINEKKSKLLPAKQHDKAA